jgi:hypothetical protein
LDEREEALSMKKVKIELEHTDLLEKRNALYILMAGLPIAFLTITAQLNYIVISNVAFFVVAAAEIMLAISWFSEGYNQQLAEKRKELDKLADELLEAMREKERLTTIFEKMAQEVKLQKDTEETRHKAALIEEILGKLKSPYKTRQDQGVVMARLFKDRP